MYTEKKYKFSTVRGKMHSYATLRSRSAWSMGHPCTHVFDSVQGRDQGRDQGGQWEGLVSLYAGRWEQVLEGAQHMS